MSEAVNYILYDGLPNPLRELAIKTGGTILNKAFLEKTNRGPYVAVC
jgi:hypothetical protein